MLECGLQFFSRVESSLAFTSLFKLVRCMTMQVARWLKITGNTVHIHNAPQKPLNFEVQAKLIQITISNANSFNLEKSHTWWLISYVIGDPSSHELPCMSHANVRFVYDTYFFKLYYKDIILFHGYHRGLKVRATLHESLRTFDPWYENYVICCEVGDNLTSLYTRPWRTEKSIR